MKTTGKCEVCLWVPTKGWKFVREFDASEQAAAIELALSLTPLEVRLTAPDGRFYFSGRMHTGDYTTRRGFGIEHLGLELGLSLPADSVMAMDAQKLIDAAHKVDAQRAAAGAAR